MTKAWLAIAVALLMGAAPAQAQGELSGKTIRILVGFTPGSVADITARLLGNRMGQLLGAQVVVENRPGAASSLAGETVARAPKDGTTLFLASAANVANAAVNPNLTFDIAKDLAPVAQVNAATVVLVVHPSLAVDSVKALVDVAKAKPGELSYASTGNGSAPHLSGELFQQQTGAKLVHVPYPGSPQAATDLLAGRVQVMFSPASAVVGLVRDGKLKALATTGQERAGAFPELPTMIEGGMANFDTAIWFGLMAPAGTPREIVDKLATAAQEAARTPEVANAWKPQGIDVKTTGPAEFGTLIGSELKRWSAVADAAGLKK